VYRTIRKCEGKTWDGILASLLRSCTRLATLDLDCGPVSDKGLGAALRHCASLVELRLRGINVHIPADVAIPSLSQLDMRSCIVTDAVMVAISKTCTNMRNLYLFAHWDANRVLSITDAGVLAVLVGCPRLQNTDVEYAVSISRELRIELAKRSNYTEMRFQGWPNIDNRLAQEVLEVSPSLVLLECRETGSPWGLSNATLAVCAQHCPLLELILLQDCKSITAEGFLLLVGAGNKLRKVHLAGCQQLGEEAVLAIAEHCPRLKMCFFTGMKPVSDAAVVKLAEVCPLLTDVTVPFSSMCDTSLIALATHCADLHTLRLSSSAKITMQAVRTVAGRCLSMRNISLPPLFERSELSQLFPPSAVIYMGGRR
jgi:hypothetical protein